MSTTEPSDILRTIMAQLPGAEAELVKAVFRSSLYEFLRKSTAWRENISLSVYPDVYKYQLTPAEDSQYAEVAWVLGVYDVNGNPVSTTTNIIPDNVTDTSIRGYRITHPNELEISSAPSEATTLTVVVAKKLKENVLRIPDFIITHHRDAIESGVLSRMFKHKGKPYSDPDLYNLHARAFSSAIVEAKDMANRGYNRGPSNWYYPQGFAPGSGRRSW